ncbi:cupin domain-containing protein [Neptuniibacter halophilus]|uniref:cupin domain-containing protein n=1 Tax=Neptuniibacter halophilus TaxID=651666 RepID=UPI002572C721|nr:cupin domain-containing protein [Neptuniibacter halophilus]
MNLYDLSGSGPDAEKFDPLFSLRGVRVERIISHGQATPEGQWYDQAWDEWVLLISGSAALEIAGLPEQIELQAGDHYLLPAHQRHRVARTDSQEPTIWLALHFDQHKIAGE